MGLIFSQAKKGDSVSQDLLGPFRQREGRSPWQQSILWDASVVQCAMNITDKAKSTPPAPTREAFSKSRECISVCCHFWYWKTDADTGYQNQNLLSWLKFSFLVAGLPDEDIWRLTQSVRERGDEGKVRLTAGPTPTQRTPVKAEYCTSAQE